MRCFSSRAAAPLRSFSSVAAPLRKRNVMRLGDAEPIVSNDAWVAPCATVAGKVLLYDASSVWFGAVVRADHGHTIRIGAMAAVQEKAVIQTVASLASGFPPDVRVGNYARVGAGATLISCHVGHFAQIGEGAIIGEGAVVEDHAAVAPNAVVAAGRLIKKGEYWAGNPAEFVRELEEEEARQKGGRSVSWWSLSSLLLVRSLAWLLRSRSVWLVCEPSASFSFCPFLAVREGRDAPSFGASLPPARLSSGRAPGRFPRPALRLALGASRAPSRLVSRPSLNSPFVSARLDAPARRLPRFPSPLRGAQIDAHNAVAEQNVWAASNHAHEFPPYHGTAFRELTYASADAPRAESGPPKSPLDAPRPTLPRTSTRV
jgi:carbonic anhydrase/acetyltransferase-like protein (isoleucine patch superfamily)